MTTAAAADAVLMRMNFSDGGGAEPRPRGSSPAAAVERASDGDDEARRRLALRGLSCTDAPPSTRPEQTPIHTRAPRIRRMVNAAVCTGVRRRRSWRAENGRDQGTACDGSGVATDGRTSSSVHQRRTLSELARAKIGLEERHQNELFSVK